MKNMYIFIISINIYNIIFLQILMLIFYIKKKPSIVLHFFLFLVLNKKFEIIEISRSKIISGRELY